MSRTLAVVVATLLTVRVALAQEQGAAPSSPGGAGDVGSLNPPMVGDLGRRGYRLVTRHVSTPAQTDASLDSLSLSLGENLSLSSPGSTTVTERFRIPVLAPAIKIAENESPRPLDRVFVGYNYFDSLKGLGTPSSDVHRETFGF